MLVNYFEFWEKQQYKIHKLAFFSSLAEILAFFAKSPSRLAVLDSVSKQISRGSSIRCNCNNRLV